MVINGTEMGLIDEMAPAWDPELWFTFHEVCSFCIN
jgi:hypothetical protein